MEKNLQMKLWIGTDDLHGHEENYSKTLKPSDFFDGYFVL